MDGSRDPTGCVPARNPARSREGSRCDSVTKPLSRSLRVMGRNVISNAARTVRRDSTMAHGPLDWHSNHRPATRVTRRL